MVSSGFTILKGATPENVAPFLSYEHPQTIALILSQLSPAQAAGILDQFPERLQIDVSYRIATMREVTPAVLKELEEAIAAVLRNMLGGTRDVGGPKVLADLLNLSSPVVERAVLEAVEQTDGEVSEAVKVKMFTFDDIARLHNADLQTLLDQVEQDQLAIALKTAREPTKDRLRSVLGDERWKAVAERLEYVGPMRLGDVEQVQLRIVQQVRRLEEQGQITIVRSSDETPFV